MKLKRIWLHKIRFVEKSKFENWLIFYLSPVFYKIKKVLYLRQSWCSRVAQRTRQTSQSCQCGWHISASCWIRRGPRCRTERTHSRRRHARHSRRWSYRQAWMSQGCWWSRCASGPVRTYRPIWPGSMRSGLARWSDPTRRWCSWPTSSQTTRSMPLKWKIRKIVTFEINEWHIIIFFLKLVNIHIKNCECI